MTNFQFLAPEFKALLEPAKGAEQLVYSDPRACCMRTRHALEQAVHWLYENDRDLHMPYDRSLNALLTNRDFEDLPPPQVLQKMRLIQKAGNQAVHGSGLQLQRCHEAGARAVPRAVLLARTYTRVSDPKAFAASFDEKRVPQLVSTGDAATFTREELKKQEAKFQQQIADQHAALEKREAAIAEQAATLAENPPRVGPT